MKIATYGNLMDMANGHSDERLKSHLRESFQSWCSENGRMPFNPETVNDWRNTPIGSTREEAELVMKAFGLA